MAAGTTKRQRSCIALRAAKAGKAEPACASCATRPASVSFDATGRAPGQGSVRVLLGVLRRRVQGRESSTGRLR